PGAARFVGIDFSHDASILCLANSAGEVIASATVEYSPGAGWDARVRQTMQTMRELAVGEIHLEFLARIGVGLPGPNSATGHRFPATQTPTEPFQLVKARVREMFADEFGCDVLVDHHIRFAALYEASIDGQAEHSIIYLRLSTGVGGALLDSGTALRGAHLLAGEIGHMISDESPSARTCRCGRRGCLGTVASKGALTEAAPTAAAYRPCSPMVIPAPSRSSRHRPPPWAASSASPRWSPIPTRSCSPERWARCSTPSCPPPAAPSAGNASSALTWWCA